MALNLEKQLRFYGAYHHNPVNIVIHTTCVPVILWTFFLLCTNSPRLVPLPESLTITNLPPNAGTTLCLLYCALYILLEPVAGGTLSVILLAGTAYANHLSSTYGARASYWAFGAHLASWIAQFIGHGVFEGRAPALLDNLVQAVFLAPLFVWLEILFSLGYRPGLKERLEKAVQADISKFRMSKESEKTKGKPT
ncbi:hypothetical protein GJ744_008549 [Endocarpon pusillum]|uniref:DUF962 domain protein n=1 Tax=Endocarpon pusillum TaxID=364733 RepID=A0A8H7E5J2_9EURO|nr:hypothetical protein GJ744_008549 [Endocarpon pusillum]